MSPRPSPTEMAFRDQCRHRLERLVHHHPGIDSFTLAARLGIPRRKCAGLLGHLIQAGRLRRAPGRRPIDGSTCVYPPDGPPPPPPKPPRPRQTTHRPYTPAENQALLAAYGAGATLNAIAVQLGRTRNSIKTHLDKLSHRGQVPRRRAPVGGRPALLNDPQITAEDRAWMAWWSQPRARRRRLETSDAD